MSELQTVESLNCTVERTETPPFYRLTSLKKAASNSENNLKDQQAAQAAAAAQARAQSPPESSSEKGTLHTKRASQTAEEQQR